MKKTVGFYRVTYKTYKFQLLNLQRLRLKDMFI